jgi:mannose-6-phosphate isomerase-like protein (cupin superfamily)
MTTRRELCLSLPALALLGESLSAPVTASAQPLQEEPKPTPEQRAASAAVAAKGTEVFAHNQIFRASVMPIKSGPTGSSQSVNRGSLPTGEGVEMHNTMLLPGHEPHPPHRHEHSEWLLIREGNVDWLIDGVRQPAGPGDICYASGGQLHGIRNVGTVPARYFVMAVGPNLKS